MEPVLILRSVSYKFPYPILGAVSMIKLDKYFSLVIKSLRTYRFLASYFENCEKSRIKVQPLFKEFGAD